MNNPPFISKLKLKNYKNIVIEDKICFNNLSILIGPNGCGKSNLIGIFRFLKDCLTEPTDYITSLDEAIINLGGEKILDRVIQIPAKVLFGSEFNHVIEEIIYFDVEVSIDNDRGLFCYISREALYSPNNRIFYETHLGKGFVLVGNDNNELKDMPQDEVMLKYLPILLNNNEIPAYTVPAYKIRENMIEIISKWHFYNSNYMDINEIRLSEPKLRTGDIFLSSNCENLARVIYNLFQKDVDFDEKLNQAIKQILPTTKKVRAIHAGELSLTVEWHVEGMKEPFYLYEMSDGMVRMSCWAVMLHSPRLPSLLIIEESASERTQVIISTHSPDLLDHFTDRVEDVICFHFDGKSH